MNPNYPQTLEDLNAYAVNRKGMFEVVKASLYDYQLYPAAGSPRLSFFANQQGKGVTSSIGAVVGQGKTPQDTNMTLSGQLPVKQGFLAESLEVYFWPGSVATALTFIPAGVATFAVAAADALANSLEDVSTINQAGAVRIYIGGKEYLYEAPVGRFPPMTRLNIDVATGSNSATVGEVIAGTAYMSGAPYLLDPFLPFVSNQNFAVTLDYPAAVAMPSGFNGRIGIVLGGWMYRESQ